MGYWWHQFWWSHHQYMLLWVLLPLPKYSIHDEPRCLLVPAWPCMIRVLTEETFCHLLPFLRQIAFNCQFLILRGGYSLTPWCLGVMGSYPLLQLFDTTEHITPVTCAMTRLFHLSPFSYFFVIVKWSLLANTLDVFLVCLLCRRVGLSVQESNQSSVCPKNLCYWNLPR